jgi:hypothetical protein
VGRDYPAGRAGLSMLGTDDLQLDAVSPVVSRVVELSCSDGGGGICPGYEFIGIPYNDCGYESPFVADVLDIYILLLVSYNRKLGATDFSNVHVNFLIISSNPSICCFISFCCCLRLVVIGFTYI